MTDETHLTQQSWNVAAFRNKPRIERERDVSMLIGGDWTIEAACAYVSVGQSLSPRKLERAGLRHTTAGRIRGAGFAVVHTPGAIKDGPHVSIVWPDTNPLERQDIPWPDEVSARFDACFNEVEET